MSGRRDLSTNKKIALDSFRAIETLDESLAASVISREFVNRETEDDPEDIDRQLNGPAGFMATAKWLKGAFSDLHFHYREVVAEGDVVIVAATMVGRHTGEFQRILPTGKEIHHNQVHIFHIGNDGKIVEHRAVRDDLSLMLQLGWIPRN